MSKFPSKFGNTLLTEIFAISPSMVSRERAGHSGGARLFVKLVKAEKLLLGLIHFVVFRRVMPLTFLNSSSGSLGSQNLARSSYVVTNEAGHFLKLVELQKS